MNKFIFAVLGAACWAMPATSAELLPSVRREMTEIGTGQTKAVVAHGICRQITNNNASPVMIPHKTAEEWSVGTNSFLASARPGLTVQNCPPQPPTEDCFLWSGWLFPTHGGSFSPIGTAGVQWEGPSGNDNVGFGEYPDAYGSHEAPGPFYLAANGTLDGLAIGKRTRVIIYSGKNFTGDVLLDETGPKVYSSEFPDFLIPNWKDGDWSSGGPLFDQFTPDTRHMFSGYSMHSWGYGSVKVTCN